MLRSPLPLTMKRSRFEDNIATESSKVIRLTQPDTYKLDHGHIEYTTHEDETVNGHAKVDYPIIWTENQWLERREKHKWLTAKNGHLGCKECALATGLGGPTTLSVEWINCLVKFNGSCKKQQLKSLRTKISAHQQSNAHRQAALIIANVEKTNLATVAFQQQQEEEYSQILEKVFNTVYYLAKNDKPYSDLDDLVQLQIMNGVDFGNVSSSNFSAAEIINHIASEFRENLTSKLVSEDRKLSIVLDESTNLSKTSVLIVFIKTVLGDNEELVFLDIIPLINRDSNTIVTALLCCLESHGMTETYLKKNLICFATDGTSSLLGKNSGVSKLLLERLNQPEIIIWHCLNHRLELTVYDSIVEIGAVNNFKYFIDIISCLCNQSQKNSTELKSVAYNLNVQITKIGRALDIRWISSSLRSIQSVWMGYVALFTHFKDAANDASRASCERKKFRDLYQCMESVEFLKDLSIMHDILDELTNLSLQLQERFCTLLRAKQLIKRSVRIIGTIRDKPGEKEKEILSACDYFQGIALRHSEAIVNINRQQFITSVINNLESRYSDEVCGDSNAAELEKYEGTLADIEVLSSDTWPEDLGFDLENENGARYGEKNIRNLCDRFRLDNSDLIINGFRDFFRRGGQSVPKDLIPLTDAIKTIPRSTIECEKSISTMNLIISQLRTKLSFTNISSLMFIKINGPPISSWNPTPCVKSFVANSTNWSAEDTKLHVCTGDAKLVRN